MLPRDFSMRIAKINLMVARWFNLRPRFTPYAIETVSDSFRVSSAKAREHLGYQTRVIEETLRDTVAWWRLWQRRPAQWSFLLGRGLAEAPQFR